jgi:hypothetical protein
MMIMIIILLIILTWNMKYFVRFQVLTAASMKIRAFWDVAPYSLVGVNRRFRGAYSIPGDGGCTHVWNIGLLQRDYMALYLIFMKCFVMPVIIGATRIVSKGLKNLETIPGQHSVDSLQKAALLGTSHIIRKVVLQSETWRITGSRGEVPGKRQPVIREKQNNILINDFAIYPLVRDRLDIKEWKEG